jgi:hypothetical protein
MIFSFPKSAIKNATTLISVSWLILHDLLNRHYASDQRERE